MPSPLVTVVCVTFNHARYISQALDSFLMQETNFPFQVFVADDCSSDGTREIVSTYGSLYPEVIVPFFPEKNQGAERNLIAMCQQAKTPFIAICDGDDYWTDSRKLQNQFDYMSSHPLMRACFHDTQIVVEEEEPWFLADDYSNTQDGILRWCSGHKKFTVKDEYSISDYIACGFVHSSSMFIRWDDEIEIPEWYFNHILGDYTLWCIQVGLGTFGYLDSTMSVYRRHSRGAYNFRTREDFWAATKLDWIAIDEDLKGYFSSLEASDALLELFEMRQSDDLGKLLKYAYRNCDELVRDNILLEYAELIAKHTGIQVNLDLEGRPDQESVRAIDKWYKCTPKWYSKKGLKRAWQAFTKLRL